MKKKILGLAVLITAVGLASLFLATISTLTVRLPRDQHRLIDATRVYTGDRLDLRYVHSVERTPVVGRFTIGKDHTLLVTETRMISVGNGLPNTSPNRTRRQGEWIVVDEGDRMISDLRFYATDVNQTCLMVAGRKLDLDTIQSGNLLRIALEHPRLIQWGRWRVTGRSWALASTR